MFSLKECKFLVNGGHMKNLIIVFMLALFNNNLRAEQNWTTKDEYCKNLPIVVSLTLEMENYLASTRMSGSFRIETLMNERGPALCSLVTTIDMGCRVTEKRIIEIDIRDMTIVKNIIFREGEDDYESSNCRYGT